MRQIHVLLLHVTIFKNLVSDGKNSVYSQKSKITQYLSEVVTYFMTLLNTTTVKFGKFYRNCESSHSLCPPDNKAVESFNLTGYCLHLDLTKHDTVRFVVIKM